MSWYKIPAGPFPLAFWRTVNGIFEPNLFNCHRNTISTLHVYLTFPLIVYGLPVAILKVTSLGIEHSLLYIRLKYDLETFFCFKFQKNILKITS